MTYGSKSSRRKSVAEALIAAVAKLHHAPLVHKDPEFEALASQVSPRFSYPAIVRDDEGENG